MLIYQPYTYLIGWSVHNKWYYGVRFANYSEKDTANPSELWVAYFTSSRHVQKFREENGDPDIIQIRKTFSSKESARLWGHKVLRRMRVTLREEFLNKSDAISIPSQKGIPKPPGHGVKIGNFHRGRKRNEETRKKISEVAKKRVQTEEANKKRSEKLKGRVTWNKGLSGYKRGPYKKRSSK
jgi:hypothetical protein